MPSLKKWLRDNLPWSSTQSEPVPDPLPFLPTKRPSILTPSPSKENLASSMDSYGYFQHLPYEIRRQILTEALGGRTLHVDLTYLNRPVRKKGKYMIGKDGAYAYAKSKTWGWYSCECHQTDSLLPDGIPRRNFGEERWITNQRKLPCAGGCKDGRNHRECGPEVDDKQPLRCRVNAMGWILACRQAWVISLLNPVLLGMVKEYNNGLNRYADGVDILFSTNNFHMDNFDLLLHLPRLILPQRLRSIESMEVSWTFRPTATTDKPLNVLWNDPTTKDSALHELCRMVPELFPRVRQLDINILGELRLRPDTHSTVIDLGGIETVFLGPIEDMVRALGPGREVCIAIQQTVFHILFMEKLELYGQDLKQDIYNPYNIRFWKELDPDGGLGYWICDGAPDQCQVGNIYFNNY
ncbi:hypothetical protein VE04_10206 [Pseudogymnoascus sp. 24MN13]|nr:hypothetical protein VE04_10206 [Pseudogymnoascus sp. 24MN13]